MALVIGVDSSTQSTKVEIRDLETGAVVARGSAPHPPTTPPVSEQDPEAWWTALTTALQDALAPLGQSGMVGAADDVVAVSVAGQQHGLVLVDADGRTIRPAKLWNDTTSAACAVDLVEQLGAAAWADGCGSVPLASFTVSKLAWMARHEPQSLAPVAKIMLPHDYLTWRLSDRHVTDRGDASGTGWFDPGTGTYSRQLLGSAVAEPDHWLERLPLVLGPQEAAGEISERAAQALGLGPGVVIGPGTGDNMAAALGLGLRPGDVAMSLGTSGTIYAVAAKGTHDPSGAVAGFADAAGGFLPLVCTMNATGVTDTVAAWLGTDAAGLGALAMEVPADTLGPVLVPYFDGERTPNRPDAAGSLFGLRRTTTRAELARSAHDGVLSGLLDGLDALTEVGVEATGQLRLIGGGARSAAYRQRCADLHGAPIIVPEAEELVAAGAAVQAAATVTGQAPAELAASWGLDSGLVVEPVATNGAEVRSAYSQRAVGAD